MRRFLARRMLKILPAYYTYLLFQVISRHFPLRSFIWQNLLQLQNYTGTPISHTWTVSLEVHFYLLIALVMAYMVGRRSTPFQLSMTFIAIALASAVLRTGTIYFGHGVAASFYTHNRLDTLIFGVLGAILYYFYPASFAALSRRKAPLIAITVLLGLFLVEIYPSTVENPRTGWGYFGPAILYVGYGSLLLLLLRHTQAISRLLPYRAIAWIGTYSYSIYLWHNSVRTPCYWLASHLPLSLQWPVLWFGQYLGAIALGTIMALAVEWPLLRLRDSVVPRSAPSTEVLGRAAVLPELF